MTVLYSSWWKGARHLEHFCTVGRMSLNTAPGVILFEELHAVPLGSAGNHTIDRRGLMVWIVGE